MNKWWRIIYITLEKNTVSEKSYDGAYTGCEVWAFSPPRLEVFTNSNKRSLLKVSGKQILKWQFVCRKLIRERSQDQHIHWEWRKQDQAKGEVELRCSSNGGFNQPLRIWDYSLELSWIGTSGPSLYTTASTSYWMWAAFRQELWPWTR